MFVDGPDGIRSGRRTEPAIRTGIGQDIVHAHFGRGTIRCGSAHALVYISHKSRPHYKLTGCVHISYKTLGY